MTFIDWLAIGFDIGAAAGMITTYVFGWIP